MAARDDFLIDTLTDMGLITSDALDTARIQADGTGQGVLDTLIANGALKSADVAQAKAATYGVEFVPLSEMRLTDDVIAAVPRHIAKRFNAVPVFRQDGTVAVAMADPSDLDTLDGLRHSLNMEVEPRVATPEDIEAALTKYYGGGVGSGGGGRGGNSELGKMIQDITE
ncbi:MAG TPA: type II/IV secretion system protein, partial [Methylomirabilota bacterium]|nr:type II/IV secretion system protein [Methylomirabilota bacterium]